MRYLLVVPQKPSPFGLSAPPLRAHCFRLEALERSGSTTHLCIPSRCRAETAPFRRGILFCVLERRSVFLVEHRFSRKCSPDAAGTNGSQRQKTKDFRIPRPRLRQSIDSLAPARCGLTNSNDTIFTSFSFEIIKIAFSVRFNGFPPVSSLSFGTQVS